MHSFLCLYRRFCLNEQFSAEESQVQTEMFEGRLGLIWHRAQRADNLGYELSVWKIGKQ